MNLKICITLIILTLSFKPALEKSKVYSRLSHTVGFTGYADNLASNQALDNRLAVFINTKGYFVRNKQWFIKAAAAKSHATLNRPIEIKNNLFDKGDQFNIEAYSISTGYELKFLKMFDISPYSGILFNEYTLNEDGTRNKYYINRLGVPLGIDFIWRTKMDEEKGKYFHLYFNNSMNYSGLSKVNENFSNFYYAYAVGFGITKKFELNKPKKKKRKKRKRRRRR